MYSLVGKVEEQRPGLLVVGPDDVDGLLGYDVGRVGTLGIIIYTGVPPKVQVSASLVFIVGLRQLFNREKEISILVLNG